MDPITSELVRGNIGEVSSGATLRLTGTLLPCQFVKRNNETYRREQIYGIVRTTGDDEIQLDVWLDSGNTSLEDLQTEKLLVNDDFRKTSGIHEPYNGGKAWSMLHGIALIVLPHEDAFLRVGVAGNTGHRTREILCSNKHDLEDGVLALEGAELRTIYSV